jgi:hypothetical protein
VPVTLESRDILLDPDHARPTEAAEERQNQQ